MNDSILITGANGFLGSSLVNHFAAKGIEVKGIVRENSDTTSIGLNNCEIFYYDGTINSLKPAIDTNTTIIHTASLYIAEHNEKEIDDLINANIVFGIKILEVMKLNFCKKILNIGTAWQNFEGKSRRPVNLYAFTKQSLEDAISFYCDSENISAISLRLNDTYGELDNRMKLIKSLLVAGARGDTLEMSDGYQEINLMYIDDVIDAIDYSRRHSFQDQKLVCYDIFSDDQLSLRDLASLITNITGLKININWGARSYREREVMAPTNLKRLPGWMPKYNLRLGIEIMLKSIKIID